MDSGYWQVVFHKASRAILVLFGINENHLNFFSMGGQNTVPIFGSVMTMLLRIMEGRGGKEGDTRLGIIINHV